ncbi:cysteine peptidase family C39 domain-containing protein [Dysgonomonas macrotermitis]|uniref:Peptidase C39 family protein n=1 Tax=Dysgonomonas macrotermitis TaxID=1346286 RepID=A0A1M5CWU6_9BACT|nr:cysteine peptidase family C39 domain-containing protein [Dysgonomonas macrotermitis]SHF59174.1 Peptidase C39 family protein [Dysgonomonas macrotermitis]
MNASHFYLVNLISSFLSARNIVHNRNILKVQYEFESKKSPIITISNLLKDYDLHSRTYLADFDTLQKERKHALLHLRISDGRFVMLKKISSDGNVTFFDPVINKNIEISKPAFLKLWSNVVIYSSESVVKSSNKKYEKVES